MAYKIGDVVENFYLDSDEGRICLDRFKGKWIVLYFYPRDNTPGCTTEAIEFSNLLEEFQKLNAVVIGISRDSLARHLNFRLTYNLRVMLLSDEKVWGFEKRREKRKTINKNYKKHIYP